MSQEYLGDRWPQWKPVTLWLILVCSVTIDTWCSYMYSSSTEFADSVIFSHHPGCFFPGIPCSIHSNRSNHPIHVDHEHLGIYVKLSWVEGVILGHQMAVTKPYEFNDCKTTQCLTQLVFVYWASNQHHHRPRPATVGQHWLTNQSQRVWGEVCEVSVRWAIGQCMSTCSDSVS